MDYSVISKIMIEIPLVHIAIFAALCTLVAVIGKLKFLILFIYGAVLYWVFLLNRLKFAFSQDADLIHTGLFILTAIIFVGCAAWVFFIER